MTVFWRRIAPADYATPVWRRPSLDFSVTGLVYCAMMLFMGLAALNSQANLLFGVFGLMIGILLISGIISRGVLRRLSLHRVLPEHGVVGREMSVSYEFKNLKHFWPSFAVTIAEMEGVEAFVRQPHGYLLHVAPRSTTTVPVQLIPKRRGLHAMGRYQLSTSFPFGFIKRAIDRRQEDKFLVFPTLAAVDPKLLALCRSAESTGTTMRPRRGGSDEFYGLKEYRTGENPRWIYWRRSARTGTLVSREMTHVSPPRLLMLLDTHAADRTGEEPEKVEQCIAMAASLVNAALETGLPVGLIVWNDEWQTIAPSRGKRQRLDLLSILARLPLNTEHGTQELLGASHAEQKSGTTIVLVTPRDVQLGLQDSARGSFLVIAPGNPQTERWFTFPPNVDFAHAMPPDQQPGVQTTTTTTKKKTKSKS
jgi:uncharacterized protein (DUF58 family)